MRNIIIGITGFFFFLFVVTAGLDIYRIQVHKNNLQRIVPEAVEKALEEGFYHKSEECCLETLNALIRPQNVSKKARQLEVLQMDMNHGVLQVLVTEELPLISGKSKKISIERTAIIERVQPQEEKVLVTFYVDGEVYKSFKVTKGECCPFPKVPEGGFLGWVEYGSSQEELVQRIGPVWENKTYLAVTK